MKVKQLISPRVRIHTQVHLIPQSLPLSPRIHHLLECLLEFLTFPSCVTVDQNIMRENPRQPPLNPHVLSLQSSLCVFTRPNFFKVLHLSWLHTSSAILSVSPGTETRALAWHSEPHLPSIFLTDFTVLCSLRQPSEPPVPADPSGRSGAGLCCSLGSCPFLVS